MTVKKKILNIQVRMTAF